ncbi:MAG TPA: hypothetical protein DCY88_05740 [Cyanobacteria bacterium UBA11372]|nr:hypothetical protein [Cyanobacteria bacterium UBA11372]
MKISYHYLGLALAILVGIGLRFWNLDFKPLWLDEVITALMSLGRSYNDVPLQQLLPIERVRQIFTLNPTATCPQIASNLVAQSTHPPLFFCLMHAKVAAWGTHYQTLSNDLRSLPALFGVGAIAAIYYLNRIAFSKTSGLTAAAVMAVSPFGVYLSQEARHYTLPVLLITLSLLALIHIQQDIQKQRFRLSVWLAWVAVNSIGFYVHYFFILAYIAQIVTLFCLLYKVNLSHQSIDFSRKETQRQAECLPHKRTGRSLLNILPAHLHTRTPAHLHLIITFCLLPLIFFLPWLPLMLGDLGRPETNWIPLPNNILPFFQTLLGWILMVVALPVESYPLPIAIPAVILMILLGIWLFLQSFKGLKQLWQTPETHSSTWTLLCFTACVLLQFFAIVYLMGKDITVVPRYNFVYYPAISALLAASLIVPTDGKMGAIKKFIFLPASPCPPVFSLTPSPTFTRLCLVLLVGFISCIFVVYDLAFQKPYNPQEVAKNMNVDPALPLAVVMGYNDYQDVALGLSFGLALDKIRDEKIAGTYLAFYERSPNYLSVLQSLSQMSPPTTSQLNLWLVIPGLKPKDYPSNLPLSGATNCNIDLTQHHRLGIPYQLYRCE